VFADVPYGWHAQWGGSAGAGRGEESAPLWRVLDAVLDVLPQRSIVAVSSSKEQRARHAGYDQLQRLRAGRRQITILRPAR
jgi:hypothetical protein